MFVHWIFSHEQRGSERERERVKKTKKTLQVGPARTSTSFDNDVCNVKIDKGSLADSQDTYGARNQQLDPLLAGSKGPGAQERKVPGRGDSLRLAAFSSTVQNTKDFIDMTQQQDFRKVGWYLASAKGWWIWCPVFCRNSCQEAACRCP